MPKFATWRSATGCSNGPGSGAKALMKYAVNNFNRASNWGIYNCRNVRGGRSYSLHAEGRAIDVGFPVDRDGTGSSHGYALVNALLEAGPSKLGIASIIYDRRIWSAKSPDGRRYTGAHPHRDHVHIGLTRSAARGLTLATVRRVLGGQSSSGDRYESFKQAKAASRTVGMFKTRPRSAGTDVRDLQRVLNEWYPKLSKLAEDGYFGPKTRDRVRYLQRKARIQVDGIVGPQTWRVIGY